MASDIKELDFSKRRERLHEIIFEADTWEGKWFDVILLGLIIASVLAVMLETVPSLQPYAGWFFIAEWIFTILFTIEYFMRIYVVYSPKRYMTSFYGIIDLLSILPSYISLFLVGSHELMIIRALRLLRIFRIFKMGNFLIEGELLKQSMKASRAKITIFLFFVMLMVCIFGAVMHLVEGGTNEQFDSIPRSVYWAIVTLTTVGYGDISPITPLGQFLSAIIMILGYAIIAVPTGIVTAEFAVSGIKRSTNSGSAGISPIGGPTPVGAPSPAKTDEELRQEFIDNLSTQHCPFCSHDGHDKDAVYCKFCGEKLNPNQDD